MGRDNGMCGRKQNHCVEVKVEVWCDGAHFLTVGSSIPIIHEIRIYSLEFHILVGH